MTGAIGGLLAGVVRALLFSSGSRSYDGQQHVRDRGLACVFTS